MPRLLFLLSLILSFGALNGQNVTIRGRATDYAGKELVFYHFPEPVTHRQQRLATTKVGPDGTFQLAFAIDQTTEVFTDLEKFKGTMLAEPGNRYEVSLPPYSPRTPVEAASPYFKPELFWLGLKGIKTTDINFLVRTFMNDYNKEVAIHTNDIYQKRSADTVAAIISRLESGNPSGGNNFLKIYKTFSYGELEYSISEPDREPVIKKYFAANEVYFSNPAYQQLFSTLFSDYLNYKSLDIQHLANLEPAKKGDFTGWVSQLKKSGFKQSIAELAATKSFYDGYFSNKSEKQMMLKGLKEAAGLCSLPPLRDCLPGIIRGIASLQEGNPAPGLKLIDQKEVLSQLKSNGKYIYLAFFRSESRDSKAELDSLVTLDKKLRSVLTIVPVSLDKNFAGAVKLWNDKKYPWPLYRPADPEKAESDYLLRTVPVFYLVSPDLKLLLSPALSPSHNFEALFLKMFRETQFRQKK